MFDIYKNKKLEKFEDLDVIFLCMALGKKAAGEVSKLLKPPQNLDFEKVISPFILLRKKGYCGYYYTKMNNPYHYLNSMGIVMKRRDNAPIVKHVYGGVLKKIMDNYDVKGAYDFVMEECEKILMGQYPIEQFIISKTLKSYYKLPEQNAHYVLAKRQEQRDAGNKFSPNDRVPFVYIKVDGNGLMKTRLMNKKEKILQGNYIETPDFIINNKIPIDYTFYITNQIQNPISQIFKLIKGYENIDDHLTKLIVRINNKISGTIPLVLTGINRFKDVKKIKFNFNKEDEDDDNGDDNEDDNEDEDEDEDEDDNDDEEVIEDTEDRNGDLTNTESVTDILLY